MIKRVLDASVPSGWVIADEAYGQVGRVQLSLESRSVATVLALPKTRDGHLDAAAANAAPTP